MQWPGTFNLEIEPVLGERPASLGESAAPALEQSASPAGDETVTTLATKLPAFELAAADERTGIADGETTAPTLCGICVPVPAPEPAVCEVQHRIQMAWRFPRPYVAYPAAASIEVSPVLGRAEYFATPPEAQPVEMPMYGAACAEAIAAAVSVQLPVNLRRTLETSVAPLADLAVESGAYVASGECAPVAVLNSVAAETNSAASPVCMPRDLAATLEAAVPLAGLAEEGGACAATGECGPVAVLESVAAEADSAATRIRLPHDLAAALETAVPLAATAPESGASAADAVCVPSAALEAMVVAAESAPSSTRLPRGLAALETAVPVAGTATAPGPEPLAPAGLPSSSLHVAPSPAGPPLRPVLLPERKTAVALPSVVCAAPSDDPPMPVESLPQVQFAAEPILARFALHYPQFKLAAQGVSGAVREAGDAAPASGATAAPGKAEPMELPLTLIAGIGIASPKPNFNAPMSTAVPQAGPLALEFYCKRANSVPVAPLHWMMPVTQLRRPHMVLCAILPPLELPVAAAPRKKASPKVSPIVARKSKSLLLEIAKPLAACFLVGAFVWLGATAMRVGTRTAVVNRDVATLIRPERESSVGAQESSNQSSAVSPGGAAGRRAPTTSAQAEQPGIATRVRQAIASRAASQLTETFREGMGAWSTGAKAAPPWSRSAEGFIRPTSFGLFRPSADYKNYRVEFFGQIEQKSMSWAVRAADPKNYYGMKVTVTEPGPRPVVAIEHYPVIGGKKGHKTQVPLPELMFHNNTPYHVEVAVNGNRVTTSIEGQEVDSWLDDALPKKGGVGFFADAGEHARVYWMKVARNEDFLGRICAYLSTGSDGAGTAELEPGTPARPVPSAPVESADAALAFFAFRGSQNRRRSASWSL